MSIVVGAASPEGIALVADSRTTQVRGEHHRVASDTALKVFSLRDRVGAATYGMAMVGDSTIRGLVEEFAAGELPTTLEGVGAALGTFMQERLDAVTPSARGEYRLPRGWPLGFVVAGYRASGGGAMLDVRVRPDTSEVREVEPSTTNPGTIYRGQTSAIERMIEGADWAAMRRLGTELGEHTRKQFELLRFDLIHPQTVHDALEFGRFLVTTAIGIQRYTDGTYLEPGAVPGCGGPVRSVLVTRAGVVAAPEV